MAGQHESDSSFMGRLHEGKYLATGKSEDPIDACRLQFLNHLVCHGRHNNPTFLRQKYRSSSLMMNGTSSFLPWIPSTY